MLGPPVCVKCEKACEYTLNVGWRCPQCGKDSKDHAFTIPKALFVKIFPDVPPNHPFFTRGKQCD